MQEQTKNNPHARLSLEHACFETLTTLQEMRGQLVGRKTHQLSSEIEERIAEFLEQRQGRSGETLSSAELETARSIRLLLGELTALDTNRYVIQLPGSALLNELVILQATISSRSGALQQDAETIGIRADLQGLPAKHQDKVDWQKISKAAQDCGLGQLEDRHHYAKLRVHRVDDFWRELAIKRGDGPQIEQFERIQVTTRGYSAAEARERAIHAMRLILRSWDDFRDCSSYLLSEAREHQPGEVPTAFFGDQTPRAMSDITWMHEHPEAAAR